MIAVSARFYVVVLMLYFYSGISQEPRHHLNSIVSGARDLYVIIVVAHTLRVRSTAEIIRIS